MIKVQPTFNEKGASIFKQIQMCYPEPVLLIGGTGWGKSFMIREVARVMQMPYIGINAHPGMDMAVLIGMWRPQSGSDGIHIVWQDGVLTECIRNGGIFLFEELTRAPQEAVSRLHGVLDTTNRYWSLPEAGEGSVPVNEKFWFVATANPSGGGYAASPLERALLSRFTAHFYIDGPMADEEKVLNSMFKDEQKIVRAMLRIACDCRNNPRTMVSTRDLVQWAELVNRGFDPKEAFNLAVMPKFAANSDALTQIYEMHFGGPE